MKTQPDIKANHCIELEIKDDTNPFYGATVLVEILDYALDDGRLDHLEAKVFIPGIGDEWLLIPWLTNQVNDGWLLQEDIEKYILNVEPDVAFQEPEYPADQLPLRGGKAWVQMWSGI